MSVGVYRRACIIHCVNRVNFTFQMRILMNEKLLFQNSKNFRIDIGIQTESGTKARLRQQNGVDMLSLISNPPTQHRVDSVSGRN